MDEGSRMKWNKCLSRGKVLLNCESIVFDGELVLCLTEIVYLIEYQ